MYAIFQKYFPLVASLGAAIIVFHAIFTGSMEVGKGLPAVSMHKDPKDFWLDIFCVSAFSLYAFYFFIKAIKSGE